MSNGMAMRRAAVFGSGGAIGAALCRALIARGWQVAAGSRDGADIPGALPFVFDLLDEASLEAAAALLAPEPPELVVVATGVLTLPGGQGPERSFRTLDPDAMVTAYRLNTVGPAMVAKHVLPLLPRGQRSVFAVLGARVGSIGDNRLGGWHSYRMSKAALAMLVRNLALEVARTHSQALVVGLHPGTVDSALSKPFQAALPPGQLTAPDDSAAHLLGVVERLTPSDSGGMFDWRGERLPA